MNTYDWIETPYRIETFVFKFKNQEAFQKFWAEYIFEENGLNKGVSYSSISTGNKVELLDKCQECLFEAIDKISDPYTENCDFIEKMEKLSQM